MGGYHPDWRKWKRGNFLSRDARVEYGWADEWPHFSDTVLQQDTTALLWMGTFIVPVVAAAVR